MVCCKILTWTLFSVILSHVSAFSDTTCKQSGDKILLRANLTNIKSLPKFRGICLKNVTANQKFPAEPILCLVGERLTLRCGEDINGTSVCVKLLKSTNVDIVHDVMTWSVSVKGLSYKILLAAVDDNGELLCKFNYSSSEGGEVNRTSSNRTKSVVAVVTSTSTSTTRTTRRARTTVVPDLVNSTSTSSEETGGLTPTSMQTSVPTSPTSMSGDQRSYKPRPWYENTKWKVALIVSGCIIVIFTIVVLYFCVKRKCGRYVIEPLKQYNESEKVACRSDTASSQELSAV